MASANDMFKKVGLPGNATTLAAPGHTIAGTSFTVVSTSLWPTDTGVTFAIDTTTLVNGVTTRVPGSYTVWDGVVASGTTITGGILRYGTDQNYPAGSTTRVYILPTSTRENRIIDGLLLAGITQTGGMGAITPTSVVASGVVTGTTLTGTSLVNTGDVQLRSTSIETIRNETQFDYVASGGVWSGDAYASTRNASMTAITVYINGQRGTISAVTARSFTASRDTYIDVLNTAGVFTLVYTEVTNNNTSPALVANSLRIGIIVTGASNIASVGSVNQGQEDKVLPIVSSVPYAVTDSLGNLICPRDPNRKILGLHQRISAFSTTSTSAAQITELSVPIIVPTGRKIKATLFSEDAYHSSTAIVVIAEIWVGTVGSGTLIVNGRAFQGGASGASIINATRTFTPTSSAITINASLHAGSAGTASMDGSSNSPITLTVELV